MTLLPPLTEEERRDIEQRKRLEEHLRAAQEAQDRARAAIAQLMQELGFPLTRSLRPEEKHEP